MHTVMISFRMSREDLARLDELAGLLFVRQKECSPWIRSPNRSSAVRQAVKLTLKSLVLEGTSRKAKDGKIKKVPLGRKMSKVR